MTASVARWSAFAALALSIVPVASVAAYVLLPPLGEAANYTASVATWTYLGVTPVCGGLAMLLGRGTPVRHLGACALGLWMFVIAFLVYELAFRIAPYPEDAPNQPSRGAEIVE